MEMRKKKAKEKQSEETPSAPSVNGSNDSNSSDMPSLNNHSSSSIAANKPPRSINEPAVNVPISQNLPPLLPHTASPGSALLELESSKTLFIFFFCFFITSTQSDTLCIM